MILGFPDKTHDVSAILAAGILQYGALVNVALGGINLIPAFPLDGGRILRSALLKSNNDYDKSTKIATSAFIVTVVLPGVSIVIESKPVSTGLICCQ